MRASSSIGGTYGKAHLRSRFFYKPITLSALAFGLIVLAYVATTQDVLEEGRDKRRVYAGLLHPKFLNSSLGVEL